MKDQNNNSVVRKGEHGLIECICLIARRLGTGKFGGSTPSGKREEKRLYAFNERVLEREGLSVIASNQSALSALTYQMWSQHWAITDLRKIDREARKIIVKNGEKHPASSTALLYLPREYGGRGLRSGASVFKDIKI